MIKAQFIGDDKIIARFKQMPTSVAKHLKQEIARLAIELQSKVVKEKLSGQVLKRKTGTLARSIQWLVESTPTSYLAVVGSRVREGKALKYAAIHEYGGIIPAHEVHAVNAKALRFQIKGGAILFRKSVLIPAITMPERSYLRSALKDMEQEIKTDLDKAVNQGVKSA
jgi:phage gpG-like protein